MSILLAALMVTASLAVTAALRASDAARSKAPPIVLEQAVPRQFGSWRVVEDGAAQIVNPQAQELLNRLYSQILSRSYRNDQGYRVMLSVAYGNDQRGELQAHRPEVCYPAQGFSVLSQQVDQVSTSYGDLWVTRLDTRLGSRREPVTYWLTMGSAAAGSRLSRRLQEIRLTLSGRIPDGLIFRISSVDADPMRAHAMQDAFVRDLLAALSSETRQRLSGLESISTN